METGEMEVKVKAVICALFAFVVQWAVPFAYGGSGQHHGNEMKEQTNPDAHLLQPRECMVAARVADQAARDREEGKTEESILQLIRDNEAQYTHPMYFDLTQLLVKFVYLNKDMSPPALAQYVMRFCMGGKGVMPKDVTQWKLQ